MLKKIFKNLLIFCVGFTIYMCIEGIFKAINGGGKESFTMGILGGVSLLFIGALNKWFTYEMPLVLQAFVGSIFITICEFMFGVILNIWLKLNIWDYTDLTGNILGQICLPFTLIWFVLSFVCIFIDDFLRYYIYDSEKPHYHLFKFGKQNEHVNKLFSL